MWLALKLLASGAFERLLKGLSAVWQWIISDWRNGPLVWFFALFLVNNFIIAPSLRSQIAAVTAQRDAEAAAHLGTVNAFLAATAQAQAEAEANVLRVEAEQETINHEIETAYRADLAALRDRFDRLRTRDAARANPGRANPVDLSGVSDAAANPDAAPGQDRLPATGALSLEDAFTASAQALQLDAVIDWIEAQHSVRFAPEADQ